MHPSPLPLGAALWYQPPTLEATATAWLWRPIHAPESAIWSAEEVAWEPLPIGQDGTLMQVLHGQLATLRGDGIGQELGIATQDLVFARAIPVALGFMLAASVSGGARWLTVANAFPPPDLGMVAIIQPEQWSGARWVMRQSEALDASGRALLSELHDLLTQFVAPARWPAYDPLLTICLQPQGYERHRATLQTAMAIADAAARGDLRQQLHELERAQIEVDALHDAARHISAQPAIWRTHWGEAQRLAHELARAYWVAYCAEGQRRSYVMATLSVPASRHPVSLPVVLVPPVELTLRACMDAHEGAVGWSFDPEAGLVFRQAAARGQWLCAIRPEDLEAGIDDRVEAALREDICRFGELEADLVLALLAHRLASEPDSEGFVWVTGARLLEYRGLRPMVKHTGQGGTYTAGQRQEDLIMVASGVERLSKLWIMRPATRGRASVAREGRWLQIAEVARRPNGPQAIAWRYRCGEWLTPYLRHAARYEGPLVHQTLVYDPYHALWEKRVCRHLLLRLPMLGTLPIPREAMTVGRLLDAMQLTVDRRNPERTRQRLEQALDRLVHDGVLTGWGYHTAAPPLPPRHWLGTWLSEWALHLDVRIA